MFANYSHSSECGCGRKHSGRVSLAEFYSIQVYLDLKETCQERDELVGRIYREHLKANRIDNPQDLTDALLKAKKEAEDEDSSVRGFMTEEDLIMTMTDMFMAGMESTATTLC